MTLTSPSAGVYIYCIACAEPFAEGTEPLRAQAIGGQGNQVRLIQFMDLVAVVSDSAVARYDIGRQNTMAHQVVLEEVMARTEILPVRFGTLAKTDEQVQEKLLKRQFGSFHDLLEYVRGHVELGLKVFWNRERVFADIAAESTQIRAIRDFLADKPPEKMRYQHMQLGELTEEAIISKRDREAEAILGELRPMIVELKVNKILTDMMVLNAAFLVEKARESEFDEWVNAFDKAQAGRLILKYVGPVPPYNFVNIVVHWED